MPYCPACGSEYRPGFERCGECNRDLVAELSPAPPPPPGSPSPWVQVFLGDFSRAEVVRASLEAAGISTLYPDEQLQTLGWFSPSTLGKAHLLIQEEDLQEALEIIQGKSRVESWKPDSDASKPGFPLPEAGLGEFTVPESPGTPAPTPRASSHPLSLRSLNRRTLVDLILATSLPIAAVIPFQDGSGWGKHMLINILLHPALVAVALWRRRTMIEAGEPVVQLWKGSEPGVIPLGIFVGALQAGLSLLYLKFVLGGKIEFLGTEPHPETPSVWHVLWAIQAVGLAPICEERFFRGGILGTYLASGRPGWGLLTSSLVFAAMHGLLSRAPLFFLDGLILGNLFLGTKSLVSPLAAHITVNAIISIVSFIW